MEILRGEKKWSAIVTCNLMKDLIYFALKPKKRQRTRIGRSDI